jgi:predicted Zn finger-like uncharacterized protein
MGFETKVDRLTCPRCGTVHDVPWDRLPMREPQMVRCNACLAVMFSGRSTRDYGAGMVVKE